MYGMTSNDYRANALELRQSATIMPEQTANEYRRAAAYLDLVAEVLDRVSGNAINLIAVDMGDGLIPVCPPGCTEHKHITFEVSASGVVQIVEEGQVDDTPRPTLAGLLDRLHAHGMWITAWYPIHRGAYYECRLTNGVPSAGVPWWGVDEDPLRALYQAMKKAEICE